MKTGTDQKTDQAIKCPKCAAARFRIVFTRHNGREVLRVKACKACGHRLRTAERVVSLSA